MLKYILTVLTLSSLLFASEDFSLSDQESSSLTKAIEVSENLYLNVNLFTALAMVDDSLLKEEPLQKTNPDQSLLTFSYQF